MSSVMDIWTDSAKIFNAKFSISFNTASNFSVVLTCSAKITVDDNNIQWTGSGNDHQNNELSSSITFFMDTYLSEINCTVTLDAFSTTDITLYPFKCK